MPRSKILVVDDNAMNRDILTRRLQRQGFEVIIAEDGMKALALAESESPHLILMDMSLPDTEGWKVSRRLKAMKQSGGIPIIGLSAHAMNEDRQRALAAGCSDYDTKPVDISRLVKKIQLLLDLEEPQADAAAVLDKAQALALCSGDEELFLELSAVFLRDAKDIIERLQQALESGDSKEVERHAHALKGISANICAGPLRESAGRLEKAGKNKALSQWEPLFQEFHREFLSLREYLQKIIAG